MTPNLIRFVLKLAGIFLAAYLAAFGLMWLIATILQQIS